MPRCGQIMEEWKELDDPEVQWRVEEIEQCQKKRKSLRKNKSQADKDEAEEKRKRSKDLDGVKDQNDNCRKGCRGSCHG